jgi:hypothetical protein
MPVPRSPSLFSSPISHIKSPLRRRYFSAPFSQARHIREDPGLLFGAYQYLLCGSIFILLADPPAVVEVYLRCFARLR